jgi:hemerythrin-like domain-containing protein
MKRDENLVPLSWDHHAGLTIAKRLRERVADVSQHAVLRDYVIRHWRAHLATHFRREEELLQPILEHAENGPELNRRLLQEHNEIRRLVDDIECGGEAIGPVLETFSIRLRAHIQFEEGTYFPAVEAAASSEELEALGEVLHREYEQADPNAGL